MLRGSATIESLSGTSAHVFGASRDPAPGEKLFRGVPQSNDLTPVSGFLSTEGNSLRINDVASFGEMVHVAIGGDGIFSSSDGGSSFAPVELSDFGVTALLASPEYLYAAASNAANLGIYRKDAAGAWATLADSSTLPQTIFQDLAAGRNGTLWVGTANHGPWRGAAGEPFVPMTNSLVAASTAHAVAVDPNEARRVYVGLGDRTDEAAAIAFQRGLLVSQDDGASWRETLHWGEAKPQVYDIAVSNVQPGVAYAATWGRGILRTADGGRTWGPTPLSAEMRAGAKSGYFSALLAVQPADQRTGVCEILFAGGREGLFAIALTATRYSTIYLPQTPGLAWYATSTISDGGANAPSAAGATDLAHPAGSDSAEPPTANSESEEPRPPPLH